MSAPWEVGSEFPITRVPVGTGGSAWAPPANLPVPATVALRSGREALRWLVRQLGAARTIHVPAFGCEALWEAFEGFEARPVEVGKDGAPQPARVAALHAPSSVLLDVPLFGWPQRAQVAEAITAFEARGGVVITDLSHGLLSGDIPRGARGVASLRKWFGLPDGGVAWGVEPPAEPSDGESFSRLRLDAQRAKARWLETGEGDKDSLFLGPLREAEELLSERGRVSALSGVSRALLEAVDWSSIVDRRRANHDRLREQLPSGLEPFAPPLGPQTVPLGLPVLLPNREERDRVRRALVAARVYCAVHWPLAPRILPDEHPTAASISDRILTLPIDQRYGAPDMDRVAELLRTALP